VELAFSRPGKPIDNAHIEAFNGPLREECLNRHWFLTLHDVRTKIEAWRIVDYESRPHSALQRATPAEFARRCSQTDATARPTNPDNSNSAQF
jgi:putative transposase